MVSQRLRVILTLPIYYKKKTETISNSNGVSTTNTYFYPSEMGVEFGVDYAPLVTKNMIFPVKVKQQTGSAIKWSKVEYGLFNTTQLLPTKLKECFKDATVDANWITRLQITAYTVNAMPATVYKNNFLVPETYSWTNKLLDQKQFGNVANNILTWQVAYKTGTSFVERTTDENGLIKIFSHDVLWRLQTVKDRVNPNNASDAQATTTFDYHYSTGATDRNYVGTSTDFVNNTSSYPLSTKQYSDGLGRGLGVVREFYTPNLLHQKTTMTYDALGRADKSFQPFESGTLGFETAGGAVASAQTIYEQSPLSRPTKQINVDNTTIRMIYATNISTDNVLNIVFTSTLPFGQGGTVTNNTSSYYAVNTLYKTIMWNENGSNGNPTDAALLNIYLGRTEIFKDRLGRAILTRKYLAGAKVDTYNVYDEFNNLVMVVPPGGFDAAGAPIASLVFTYKYNDRNNLIEKKVPNADVQKFYYDNRDLLTLTQDGNMRSVAAGGNADKYLGTQYDEIGRVMKTGWMSTTTPLSTALAVTIADVDKLTEIQYYSNRTWVKHQAAKVLKPAGVSTLREYVWSYIERRVGYEYTGNPIWTGKQHLLSKTYVNGSTLVNADGPITDNDYGGVDWSVSAYNGLQRPTLTNRNVYCDINAGSSARTVRTSETYILDNAQRLTNLNYGYTIGGSAVATLTNLSNMIYNYKDQVTEKNTALVASKYLQSTDFTYNTRGWLTSINSGFLNSSKDYPLISNNTPGSALANYSGAATYQTPLAQSGEHNPDLFKEIIRYDNPTAAYPGVGAAQRNGNISQIEWQVAGREAQGYSFKYDDLDRLTEANYTDIHGSDWSSKGWASQYETDNKFQEKQTYDLRGNIQSLQRNGHNHLFSMSSLYNVIRFVFTSTDNLTYNYDPNSLNKLLQVSEASDIDAGFKTAANNSTYAYDANGNLTSDLNKNITGITYNYLNLPLVISFTGNNRIEFIYDATGAKLRKTTYANNVLQETRDYVNGVEYKGGVVDRFSHTEGAVVRQADGTTFSHEYSIKDHLGNTRVTYRDDNTTDSPLGTIKVGEIIQINHYYPFGMNMEGNWNGSFPDVKNKYQYNGKELNSDFGLEWNDYGARWYDASIGRWNRIDPMGELIESYTPYNFVRNNPVLRIDPNGMWDIKVHGYKDRSVYGYGIAVVTDRHGNEIMRFNVRLEGVGGRNRLKESSDTPTGIYDIPNKDMWMSGGDRGAYGNQHRLQLDEKSGQIIESGRYLIRVHGGRQEPEYLLKSNKTGVGRLEKTEGCIRAWDGDMVQLKKVIDKLMSDDNMEYGGELEVVDDLVPTTIIKSPYKSTKIDYKLPNELPQPIPQPFVPQWIIDASIRESKSAAPKPKA